MQEDTFSLTTGERIGWLVKRRGVQLSDLAATLGISEPTLWRYRTDRRSIPSDVLGPMATALQTTTDFLLCLTEDPRAHSAKSHLARKRSQTVRGMGRRTSDLVLSASG
jgi:transcriptional regulator with XRE-family HTH domain